MSARRVVLVAGLIASVGFAMSPRAQSPAQQPANPTSPTNPARPTFRAAVNAVQVDLRVVDRAGRFVPDLTSNDFRVFENGQEQTVTTFSLVNIPIEPAPAHAPDTPPVEPDVASNARQDGRLYVIVLDDLENQANPLRSVTVRALAREFIERNLTDVDRAALITTSGRRDMAQEFTNNRQRLVEAANRYEGGYGQTAFTRGASGSGFNSPGGALVSNDQHTTMVSLTALADWLARIDGRRKGIVLISERLGRSMAGGIDLTLGSDEAADARDFVTAAARGNVALYVIDPVGVPGAPANGIKPIQPDMDDPSARDLDRIQSLTTLAEATGGFAAVHSNDFSGAFQRIVIENSSYYLLGYNSSNASRDGKFRNITVRVSRPDLQVLARSGYVAEKETSSGSAAKPSTLPPALAKVLESPLAVSGLALTVSAPSFHATGSKASVSVIVEAGASQLQFTPNGSRVNAAMTLAITAINVNGKIEAGERGALKMNLSPNTYDAMRERGARLISRLELKPGKYQLRVAAVDDAGGQTTGSVLYDLDVPDFSKGPLAMSGVAIAALTEAPTPTMDNDPRWKQSSLGEFPTARRNFTRFEELREYVEIYDNEKGKRRPIAVTSTVRDASGTPVFSRQDTLSAESAAAGKDKTFTHRLVTTIPLNALVAGRYVLTVEARSGAAPARVVSREIPIVVR